MNIKSIVYLSPNKDGTFDVVSKEQATVVKIVTKSGEVIFAKKFKL